MGIVTSDRGGVCRCRRMAGGVRPGSVGRRTRVLSSCCEVWRSPISPIIEPTAPRTSFSPWADNRENSSPLAQMAEDNSLSAILGTRTPSRLAYSLVVNAARHRRTSFPLLAVGTTPSCFSLLRTTTRRPLRFAVRRFGAAVRVPRVNWALRTSREGDETTRVRWSLNL
jgi:hypothetical protein